MKTRHYLSMALLLAGSTIALGWAAAQNTGEDSAAPVKFAEEPAASVEEALERIKATTGEDLGPITGFAAGTTLDEAERLYRDLKLYVAMLERQFERQEDIIASLQEEVEALQAPDAAENR